MQWGWGLQALEESALRRSEKKGVHGDPALSSHLAASQSRTPHRLPPGLRVSGPVGAESKALPNCLQRKPHWGAPLSGIRSCPGRRQVPLWRLCSGGVPKGLDRAWAGPQQATRSRDQLSCPFPASGMCSVRGPDFFTRLSASVGLAAQHREKPLPSEFEEPLVFPSGFHGPSFPQRSLRKHIAHPSGGLSQSTKSHSVLCVHCKMVCFLICMVSANI